MRDYTTTPNRQAAKVVYIYLVISSAWILFGNHLVALVPSEIYSASLFSGYEDWVVVLIGAGFIYLPVRAGYRSLIRSREAHLEKVGHTLKHDLTALALLIDLGDAGALTGGSSGGTLITTQSRIRILSRIYELLLKQGGSQAIPFREVAAYMKKTSFAGLDMHCDELHLPLSQAVPLGLLLNEVITPFVPDRQQEEEFPLTVAIKNSPDSTVSATFRLTDSPDYYYLINCIKDKSSHLEAKLIDSFTKKLGGASSWKEASGQLTFQLRFKKEQVAAAI